MSFADLLGERDDEVSIQRGRHSGESIDAFACSAALLDAGDHRLGRAHRLCELALAKAGFGSQVVDELAERKVLFDPGAARHVEVELDRTPALQLHLDELARPATHQHPHHHRAHRRDHHPDQTGLAVTASYDPNWYATGIKITDAQMRALPLEHHDWHGDWNYTLTAA